MNDEGTKVRPEMWLSTDFTFFHLWWFGIKGLLDITIQPLLIEYPGRLAGIEILGFVHLDLDPIIKWTEKKELKFSTHGRIGAIEKDVPFLSAQIHSLLNSIFHDERILERHKDKKGFVYSVIHENRFEEWFMNGTVEDFLKRLRLGADMRIGIENGKSTGSLARAVVYSKRLGNKGIVVADIFHYMVELGYRPGDEGWYFYFDKALNGLEKLANDGVEMIIHLAVGKRMDDSIFWRKIDNDKIPASRKGHGVEAKKRLVMFFNNTKGNVKCVVVEDQPEGWIKDWDAYIANKLKMFKFIVGVVDEAFP